ncbi:MAG: hypothetical protein NC827_06285 [Candidatus Omnitrophica bacterium]|nr:hypothetical protein [Candidatus Omnitrophota bacterium]MCM8802897.1 hypothetical protein [Candidatus Omnitrophota bacterium]
MKKIFFLILIFSWICFSKVYIKEEIKINGSEEEVFAIGENIDLSGIFKNEFIGVGKKISGDLKIYGDFISTALTQNLTLFTENDFYSIGNKIIFNGKTGGSFTCITRNLILENSEIGGNLRIMGNNVFLRNVEIKQKSFIYGEKIKISGIFSDLNLHGKEIEIEKGTKILGNLIYYTPEKFPFPDVEIKGKVEWKKPYGEKVKEKTTIFRKLKFFYSFFSLFFTYFLLLFFTPNLLQSTTLISGRNFIKSFLLGLLLIIIFSFFILIFLITIIGVPASLILITFFVSSLYISRGFIFIYLARNIFYKFDDTKLVWILSIFLGILIFNLLSLNLTLKIMSNIIATPTGFGALLIDRVKLFKKLREEKII